jgi:hypothetical protein
LWIVIGWRFLPRCPSQHSGGKHDMPASTPVCLLTTQSRSLYPQSAPQYLNYSIVSEHSLPPVLFVAATSFVFAANTAAMGGTTASEPPSVSLSCMCRHTGHRGTPD